MVLQTNNFDERSEEYVRTHDFDEERGVLARNNLTTYVRKIKEFARPKGARRAQRG